MSGALLRVTVVGPDGIEHDITDRTTSGVGTLTQEVEEDLLEFVHDDIDLEIDDADGWARDYFGAARAGDVYRITVERETGRRSPKWERVFSGVLDAPASVSWNHRERTVSVQVFSASKLLEFSTAENIKRTIEGRTGTVSAGSATVTLSSSADFAVGDEITLEGGGKRETQTIKRIDTATQVTTEVAFDSAFTSADVILETPYYRGRGVAELAAEVFETAGISSYQISIEQELAAVPFPTGLNTEGLPETTPGSVLESADEIKVYTGGKRYGATSITSGFDDEGADSPRVDWRPYKTSEPATLRVAASNRVWDHDSGDYFDLEVSGIDLILKKNGALLATIETGDAGADSVSYEFLGLEWHEGLSEVWVAWASASTYLGPPALTTRQRATVRVDSTSGTVTPFSALYCALRYVAALSRMAVLPFFYSSGALLDLYQVGLYDGASLSETLERADDVDLSTLRAMGDHLLALHRASGTRVAIWRHDSGELVADHLVTESSGAHAATVFDAGGTAVPAYVGYAAGTWFVASTASSNVIAYADFEGASCGEALKQLAIASAAVIRVDEYGTGYLVGRSTARSVFGLYARTIQEPALERETRAVWDEYRTSVSVVGRRENGEEFERIVGAGGDSAKRFEIDAALVSSEGLADALGQQYLDVLAREVREETVTIEEPEDGPIRVLEIVRLDGRDHLTLFVETDLVERTQQLRLVAEGEA